MQATTAADVSDSPPQNTIQWAREVLGPLLEDVDTAVSLFRRVVKQHACVTTDMLAANVSRWAFEKALMTQEPEPLGPGWADTVQKLLGFHFATGYDVCNGAKDKSKDACFNPKKVNIEDLPVDSTAIDDPEFAPFLLSKFTDKAMKPLGSFVGKKSPLKQTLVTIPTTTHACVEAIHRACQQHVC